LLHAHPVLDARSVSGPYYSKMSTSKELFFIPTVQEANRSRLFEGFDMQSKGAFFYLQSRCYVILFITPRRCK
jgi:hypothetical protein